MAVEQNTLAENLITEIKLFSALDTTRVDEQHLPNTACSSPTLTGFDNDDTTSPISEVCERTSRIGKFVKVQEDGKRVKAEKIFKIIKEKDTEIDSEDEQLC